jgi:hypothetical protein
MKQWQMTVIQNGPRKSSPGPQHSINTEINRVARTRAKRKAGYFFVAHSVHRHKDITTSNRVEHHSCTGAQGFFAHSVFQTQFNCNKFSMPKSFEIKIYAGSCCFWWSFKGSIVGGPINAVSFTSSYFVVRVINSAITRCRAR